MCHAIQLRVQEVRFFQLLLDVLDLGGVILYGRAVRFLVEVGLQSLHTSNIMFVASKNALVLDVGDCGRLNREHPVKADLTGNLVENDHALVGVDYDGKLLVRRQRLAAERLPESLARVDDDSGVALLPLTCTGGIFYEQHFSSTSCL